MTTNDPPAQTCYFLVDAFTSTQHPSLKGNPAGVLLSSSPLDDTTICDLARKLKVPALSVICDPILFSKDGPKAEKPLPISWISSEGHFIPLCGHATMAASLVLFKLFPHLPTITLLSRLNVTLTIRQTDSGAELGFPALLNWTEPNLVPLVTIRKVVQEAMALEDKDIVRLAECHHAGGNHKDLLIEVQDSIHVGTLSIEPDKLLAFGYRGTWIIGPGSDGFDMHTRAFFPRNGVPEDQVCGHAHTMFAPYWASERNLTRSGDGMVHLRSRQVSPNGGVIGIRWDGKWGEDGGRCYLAGEGRIQDKGSLHL